MSIGNLIFKTDGMAAILFTANKPSGRLAFTFSPFKNRDLNGNNFGGALLNRIGFDVIALNNFALAVALKSLIWI